MISRGVLAGTKNPYQEMTLKSGDAVLGDRWHFRRDGGALGAGIAENLHLARSRIVERGAAGKEQMHTAGNKVVHRRGSAAIRHVHHLDAGHVLEQLAAKVR